MCKIPFQIISTISEVISNYYTHEKLNVIFDNYGINDEISASSKPARINNALRKINHYPDTSFVFLGDLLSVLLEQESNKWNKNDKEKIINKLTEYNLKYYQGNIIDLTKNNNDNISEINDFLDIDFPTDFKPEQDITYEQAINQRLGEINKIKNVAPISAIVMAGATLEGILLQIAIQHPAEYNRSSKAPCKDGKILKFKDWTLSQLIDVAYDLKYIREDVKKISHSLRDFRNYIHIHEQISSGFTPDAQTAVLCLQTLNVAIKNLKDKGLINE